MAPFTGEPTHTQQVALAIVPKITASLSILGSGYIVFDCWRSSQRNKRRRRNHHYHNKTYHRLMTGLSCCDMVMSLGIFLSTWPMPRGTPFVYGAVGNTQTCTAQGFFEQIGVSAVMYNASLSVYYYLRVRCGWPPSRIVKIEPWLHAVPLVFGFATMIAGLFLELYNYGLWDCWIAPFPQGCDESWRQNTNGAQTTANNNNCKRGDNATLYIWFFDLIPKWSSILLVTGNMYLMYRFVRSRERQSNKYSTNTHRKKQSLSKRLARQSYLYVGALYITYIPVIVTRLTQLIAGVTYYGMIVAIAITIPLQGMWNFLVYLRPRYIKARRKNRRRQQLQRGAASAAESASSTNGSFFVFKAVSEAVRDGDVSEEDDDDDEEDKDGLTPQEVSDGTHPTTEENGIRRQDHAVVDVCPPIGNGCGNGTTTTTTNAC